MPSNWTRWIPAALVPVVAIAGAVLIPIAADATPALPEKSPQQLLEFIAGSADAQYSGTVDQTSNLGLPDLSSLGSSYGSGSRSAASTAVELLSGTNSARVFVGGADAARIQVKDTLAERDVIRNGSEVWTYDSKTNAVQHMSAPAGSAPDAGVSKTPADLATGLIDSIEPSTRVTVTETARVAGRAVYQLVLTPAGDATLVGSVILSVDSETGLPLDVRVFAAGHNDTAFSVGFSSIEFGAQDASLFSFAPPAGATVEEHQVGEHSEDPSAWTGFTEPEISGVGWSSIVEISAESARGITGADGRDPSVTGLLGQVLVPVNGGRALETSLVSVLLTADGRVLVGAVSIDQLQAAAAK